jgi:hypothetical protein
VTKPHSRQATHSPPTHCCPGGQHLLAPGQHMWPGWQQSTLCDAVTHRRGPVPPHAIQASLHSFCSRPWSSRVPQNSLHSRLTGSGPPCSDGSRADGSRALDGSGPATSRQPIPSAASTTPAAVPLSCRSASRRDIPLASSFARVSNRLSIVRSSLAESSSDRVALGPRLPQQTGCDWAARVRRIDHRGRLLTPFARPPC